jgi:GntR family transcriptional regulator, transcriptional repressor for pyruvate dehydrogenase complex
MKKLSIRKKLGESGNLKTLSKEVSEKLIKQILNGTYPAGSKLPTEREMAEQFHVARHIVREALKRVETLRLVRIRQGSGAVVQDFSATGGIELVDLLIVKADGGIDINFLKNILEFHTFTCIHTIKLATQRITKKELQELKRLVKDRADNLHNFEKRYELTMQISDLIVKASRNMYIQLLFNSLIRSTVTFEQIFGIPLPDNTNVQIYFERVVEAIESKDQELAGLIAARGFADNHDYIIKTMEETLLERTD